MKSIDLIYSDNNRINIDNINDGDTILLNTDSSSEDTIISFFNEIEEYLIRNEYKELTIIFSNYANILDLKIFFKPNGDDFDFIIYGELDEYPNVLYKVLKVNGIYKARDAFISTDNLNITTLKNSSLYKQVTKFEGSLYKLEYLAPKLVRVK